MSIELNENDFDLIAECNEKYNNYFQNNIQGQFDNMVQDCSKITTEILKERNLISVQDRNFLMNKILSQMTILNVQFDFDIKVTY